MPKSTAAQIAEQLAVTCSPCASNPMSADQVREYALEYLGYLDEDAEVHPDAHRVPHSNLWMHDGDYQNAIFAVLIFRKDDIEFVCGVGNAYAIKRFAENEEPDDIDEIPSELMKRFRVPCGTARFSRAAAEKWLGRSW
jgi:hypothetical protein